MADCGVAARRKCEELITAGSVQVNGEVVTTLGTKVTAGRDEVRVDDVVVVPEDKFYVLFNKPKGCITAVSDPRGRKTVMEYLRGVPAQIAPVGRLDYYTEGVLLLTNDGELSARLQSPDYEVEKTYHAKIRGQVRPRHLDQLRAGVRLEDGRRTRPAKVDSLGAPSKHDWLVITITEGKNRQIHQMLEGLGYQVQKLQRVGYAGLTFEGLRVGDARELTQAEVNTLRATVGLDRSTVSRGTWSARREDTDLARRARARDRGVDDTERELRLQGRKRAANKVRLKAGLGDESPAVASSFPRGGGSSSSSGRGSSSSSGRGASSSGRGASSSGRGASSSGRGASSSGRGASSSGRGASSSSGRGASSSSGRGASSSSGRGASSSSGRGSSSSSGRGSSSSSGRGSSSSSGRGSSSSSGRGSSSSSGRGSSSSSGRGASSSSGRGASSSSGRGASSSSGRGASSSSGRGSSSSSGRGSSSSSGRGSSSSSGRGSSSSLGRGASSSGRGRGSSPARGGGKGGKGGSRRS